MQIMQGQTSQKWITWRWKDDCTTMIDQEWTDVHKDRNNGKCIKVDTRAVWETTDKEVYSKQLILRSVK